MTVYKILPSTMYNKYVYNFIKQTQNKIKD